MKLFKFKSGHELDISEMLGVGPVIKLYRSWNKTEVYYQVLFKNGKSFYSEFGIHKMKDSQGAISDAELERKLLLEELADI